MSTSDWRQEIGAMLGLRRHIGILLEYIAEYFETMGGEFDENFRVEFFDMANAA